MINLISTDDKGRRKYSLRTISDNIISFNQNTFQNKLNNLQILYNRNLEKVSTLIIEWLSRKIEITANIKKDIYKLIRKKMYLDSFRENMLSSNYKDLKKKSKEILLFILDAYPI